MHQHPRGGRAGRGGGRAGGDARARRRVLGRRGLADARDGHGDRDPARLVRVLHRRVGGDDGGDDAAGRGPAVLRRARASGGVRAVPLFVGSYLAVWALVGVAVYALDRPHGSVAAGAVVVAAGAYELTPVKRHFRGRCRGSVRAGFQFGLCCAGSSIGLMAILVALGVMTMTWMVVIALLVLAQKLVPPEAAIDVPLALAITGLGIWIILAPSSVPGLMPPMT